MLKSAYPMLFRFTCVTLVVGAITFIATAQTSANKLYAASTTVPVQAPASASARDIDTYEHDRNLTNQCIVSGQDKKACLCVTQILKYELTVGDYQATAAQFGPEVAGIEVETVAADDRQPSDLQLRQMSQAFQTLLNAPDFTQRCIIAARYFDRR